MTKPWRRIAVALLAVFTILAVPAAAQFPPSPEPPEDGQPKAKTKGTARQGPTVLGKWAGDLTQVGSASPYKFEISITAQGGETRYPDLDCTGKLMRIGQSRSYVFFVELITKGHADKGGRCPDGTVTVARAGDRLSLGWFGSVHDVTVVAYGTLDKK